ncbi:hypothetical protein ARALYDRAFT_895933 [Arabidopsis lyrata subsp. lyrata]|uniref:WRKY domain-containing protein n=1 Tax=Arabidopsis lyrata subsp. lyrata TaxID=81972 RepID=D7KX42_ARALL|nr:hypothetical protein ARALYDRAFT_895933 [Arabidopsis lyrata subsp. lyrata]
MFSGVDKTVEALLHGQDCANHLKMQLENHETRSLQTEVLVETVLDSFSIALSFFMSITSRHHESSSQNMFSKSLKRCYYRCAYADDQNCHATQRVQMIKDNPYCL